MRERAAGRMRERAAAIAIAIGLAGGAASWAQPGAIWLESFDAAWRIVRDTYYDTSFNGHDWEAVRRELRPKAAAAGSADELRAVIREMLARLGDSHLMLLPGGAAPNAAERDGSGDPGVDVRYLEGNTLVVGIVEGSSAAEAGVRPGWLLRAVDGNPMAPAIAKAIEPVSPRVAPLEAWRIASERLRGPIGSRARLQFVDGRGVPREVFVERRGERGQAVKLGTFPTLFVRTARRLLSSPEGGRVGYIRFNVWLAPVDRFVAEAVDAYRSADGIVIDLRGNPGGLAAMLMGIAGQFVDERVSLGEMRTREGTLRFFANPRRAAPDGRSVAPFGGRVAILVDGLTGSASECFAGGMQSIGRARVFGAPTMGQALPALFDRLPSGDVLVHAYADFVTARGTRLEGTGVRPDVEAPWSREALLDGRDEALDRAVAWAGAPVPASGGAGAGQAGCRGCLYPMGFDTLQEPASAPLPARGLFRGN